MTTTFSRRAFVAALSIGTALLAACSNPTAPSGNDDECISGTYGGSGNISCTAASANASGTYGGSGN